MSEDLGRLQRPKYLFSTRGWLFIAVCALAAPLLFGIWPTSLGRALAYFMVAWMGGFFAGGALMVFGSRKPPTEGDAPK